MNEPVVIPEWIPALVGRLVLENEALRIAARAQAETAHSEEP